MHLIHKDVYNKTLIECPTLLFKGEVRAILLDENGKEIQDTGWIKNSFTTYGYNKLHSAFRYMGIGTGTGATNPGDVNLKDTSSTPVRDGTLLEEKVNTGVAGNYVFYEIRYGRFEPGQNTGTITEVGMFSSSSGNNMYCRQEITPIVKGPNNTLDVYYKITVTPDIVPATGSILIDGINYDYVSQFCCVHEFVNTFSGVNCNYINNFLGQVSGSVLPTSLEVELGGSAYDRISTTKTDGEVQFRGSLFLDDGNYTNPGGIRSMSASLLFAPSTSYRKGVAIGFTATDGPYVGYGIPKNNTQYLHVDWKMTWGVT